MRAAGNEVQATTLEFSLETDSLKPTSADLLY